MTEEEWLACNGPERMLESLGTTADARKLRVYCCACCLRVAGLLAGDGVRHARNALTVFERHLEGKATDRDLEDAWEHVYGDSLSAGHAIAHPGEADYYAVSAAADAVEFIRRNQPSYAVGYAASALAYDALAHSTNPDLVRIASEWTPRNRPPRFSRDRWDRNEEEVRRLPEYVRTRSAEGRVQSDLLRDIFGNPFRPVTFSPAWRTSTVLALASQMYEARDFSAMPILADALADAGCPDGSILEHCRGPGPHVTGCWVLDALLQKG